MSIGHSEARTFCTFTPGQPSVFNDHGIDSVSQPWSWSCARCPAGCHESRQPSVFGVVAYLHSHSAVRGNPSTRHSAQWPCQPSIFCDGGISSAKQPSAKEPALQNSSDSGWDSQHDDQYCHSHSDHHVHGHIVW